MVIYRRFPDKMIKDTYAPQSLKIQVLIVFGGTISLPLVMVFTLSFGIIYFGLSMNRHLRGPAAG
ncbi:MAG: hypothetical protein QME49_02325 [bacterium]|nr:hypothetical protein [bacterium]